MSERIKGITVEIGGDTIKLNDALRETDKQITNTQKSLKDVERLLKLDPTNTELLQQKQRLLAEAVGETKTRLAVLKEAQANFGPIDDKNRSQYEALGREIIATEQKLKSLENQAAQSNATLAQVAAAGEKLQEVGGKIESVGKKVSVASGVVAGLGAAAVKTAADFDAAMSKVAAVSGATGDDLEALREKAREMGEKTKFSASEAAEAMNYMAMAGWKTGDMLSGIEGIMNLAAASGEDLATTSDIVTDALTAFGLTASDAGHFADILAAASSNANTNVSMMGETFKYAAPVAGALGYSAEDVAEAIGLMANSGIKASQAGTSLRTILTALQGEITLSGDAFGELTIQTSNADGTMRGLNDILADCRAAFSQMSESEAASTAEAIVGKNAMSGFLAIMNAAPADIEKLNKAITNCGGAAEDMAGIMQDNLAGQMQILKSQLEELAISFGEMLMPIIRSVVEVVQGFVDKLNGMDEQTRQIILTVGLVVAALGPLLIVTGKIISAVGTIMTVLPKLQLVFTALTGPVGIAVAAVAALVAIIIALWNNCEGFRNAVTQAWTVIQAAFTTFMEWLQATFAPVWDAVVATMQTVFAAFQTAVALAWEAITGIFNTFGQFLQEVFGVTWSDVFTGMQNILAWLGEAVQTIIKAITTVFSSLVNFLTATFLSGWQNALQQVQARFTAFKGKVVEIIEGVKTMFRGIVDFIAGVFTADWERAWNGVKNIFKGVFDALVGIVKVPLNGIISMLNKAIGAINVLIAGVNKAISLMNALGANLPTIPSIPTIAYLAKGGILEAGNAIVGENGPELLSMVNGKARVTPLNQEEGGGGTTAQAAGGYNQTLNFYTAAMTPSEVARQTRLATKKMIAGVTG